MDLHTKSQLKVETTCLNNWLAKSLLIDSSVWKLEKCLSVKRGPQLQLDLDTQCSQVTEWSAWSACTSSCGRGWMYMERSVLAQPGPGGRYNTMLWLVSVTAILSCDWSTCWQYWALIGCRACPRKLTKRRRCVSTTCWATCRHVCRVWRVYSGYLEG